MIVYRLKRFFRTGAANESLRWSSASGAFPLKRVGRASRIFAVEFASGHLACLLCSAVFNLCLWSTCSSVV